jgi:hypothetical protein
MVEDPFYLVNFLYAGNAGNAGLLATKMFDMVKHDPVGFPQRHVICLQSTVCQTLETPRIQCLTRAVGEGHIECYVDTGPGRG